jgi:benzoyl-CoA reductase/2-hydroxyglutaryl-CoA dehydratase subunit BcrC/BadD/HgdB
MESRTSIEPFSHAMSTRRQRLHEASSRGRKIIGSFCTYTPIELIHACGFLPVRIWGGTGTVENAYSLVPNFICPYMRLSLENGLHGEFDFLSGLVQGYTCDVACGLVNIWKENIKTELYHSMALPYNDTGQSRAFLRSSLVELTQRLESIGGTCTEDALDASSTLYTRIRQILSVLSQRRSLGRTDLDAADFLTVVQAGFVTEPEDYLLMLMHLMDGLKQGIDTSPCQEIPVLVSGSLIEDAAILALIEQLGFRVVADELCTGLRSFTPVSGVGDNPMERLVDRIMKHFPCPSRSHPRDRIPLMKNLIAESGAKGVIFLFQKFCTPHLADHPIVSRALKEAGIPSISIEMDETGFMEAQVRTRLETFAGMLEA